MRRYREKYPEKSRESSRRWAAKNVERVKRRTRFRKYGLTEERFRAMREEQGYKCAICRNPLTQKNLCIDHNHETGKVRGLLCKSCNQYLGRIREQAVLLRTAIDYLHYADGGMSPTWIFDAEDLNDPRLCPLPEQDLTHDQA